MMTPNGFATAIAASLMPQHKALAIQIAQVFASQPNLPAWLASIETQSLDERVALLRHAAQVLRTDLPDRLAADLLLRLAEDAELLGSVVRAVRSVSDSIGVEAVQRVA